MPTLASGLHEIAVEASPDGVVVCDEAGAILYVNPRIEAIFGYAADELRGASVDCLLSPSAAVAAPAGGDPPWQRLESKRPGVANELHGCRKDGAEIPIEIGVTVATRDDRRWVVVSIVDISARRSLEQSIREAEAHKLAFERLLGDLAARFVSILPEDVDHAIVDSQRQIVEALDIDRCTLWQFTNSGADFEYTHIWTRPEFTLPIPERVSAKQLFPWFYKRVLANEIVAIDSLDDIPDDFDRENVRSIGAKSNAVVPMSANGCIVGALSFASLRSERAWSPEILDRLRLVAAVFGQGLTRCQNLLELRSALAEVERLRDQLASENVQLRRDVKALTAPRSIPAESEAARVALAQVDSVAGTDATVLLVGETGSGKEVFAEAIHEVSLRHERPMVRVNCAAIPTALVESELFGRERGAYTGALSRQIGRFELAAGTTIFLDEVAELPLESQGKLLRVLQERTLERLGSARPIQVDVRVIVATNRDLQSGAKINRCVKG
ncbi:MAG: sigma 54-interacting transcriptional regulator [Candidatus Eiseniibacteriota bacterium]